MLYIIYAFETITHSKRNTSLHLTLNVVIMTALTPRSKFIFQFSGLFGNATEESYWAFSERSQFVTAVNQMREEKL